MVIRHSCGKLYQVSIGAQTQKCDRNGKVKCFFVYKNFTYKDGMSSQFEFVEGDLPLSEHP